MSFCSKSISRSITGSIMSKLFTPIELGPLKLENRIVIAPMCQYTADEGKATDWHLIHLGQLAFSGAGLLIIEATAVEPIGRITAGCVGCIRMKLRLHSNACGCHPSILRYATDDPAGPCGTQGLEPSALGWRATATRLRRRLADCRSFSDSSLTHRACSPGIRSGRPQTYQRRFRCISQALDAYWF